MVYRSLYHLYLEHCAYLFIQTIGLSQSQYLKASYVYTLRLIGPISHLIGACYIRTKVKKWIREKMTMYFRG